MEGFDYVKIGSLIKKFRKEKKITQVQLANLIEKTESSIRKYEKGLIEIPNSVLTQIAEALNVSLLELLDLAPDDHDAIADVANKTQTHPAYIRGETKEKDSKKYKLESIIKDLDYFKLKNSITQYNNNLQDAILRLWAYYISNITSEDWYYENDEVSAKNLDTTYFLNELNDLYDDFRGYLNYIIENNFDRDNLIGVYEMESIYRRKAKLLNDISNLLDITISRTILNKDENVLIYLPEIINKYGDKKDK